MRKIKLFSVVFFAVVLMVSGQDPIKEEVKVINVEVPVRVFYKGKAVENLARENFTLYEGKKQQVITSFNISKQRIKVDKENFRPRYFVLVFRLVNYNQEFKNGFKHFFDNTLHKNDSLLVMVNDQSLVIDSLKEKEKVFARLDSLLNKQAQQARGQMSSYLKRIEQEIDMRRFKVLLQRPEFLKIQDFLKKYLMIWKDYKNTYLLPNLDRYYYFAKHLEGIKKEKWVINFFQMEMIPNIIISGDIRMSLNRYTEELLSDPSSEFVSYGRILRTMKNEINKTLNIPLDFPVEQISKLFYKVNATFHSIFMRTIIGVESRDHESMKILSDMEKCLGEISRSTGGTLVASTDLESAMNRIGEVDNLCYLLTYAPKNPKKIGKIKIKVDNKKYKVVYDDNMRTDYIKAHFAEIEKQDQTPVIRIKDLNLKDEKLSVSVVDFLLKKTDKGTIGQIGIHICIKDNKGKKIFDTGKRLTTEKDVVTITIPFKGLKKGTYDIIVDIKDFLTGKTEQKFIRENVR
ncbi:hypothetical protein ACFLRB_03110 [Acidobacteriota bacterium]